MMEFWNFKDAGIIFSHNWLPLLVALLAGIYVGWRVCERDDSR